jgi:hypothetical protein
MGGSGQFSSANSGRTPDVGFGQTFSSGDIYYSLSFKIPAGGLATSGAGNIGGFSNFAVPSTNPAGVFQAGLRLIPSTTTAYQLGMTGGGTTQTYAARRSVSATRSSSSRGTGSFPAPTTTRSRCGSIPPAGLATTPPFRRRALGGPTPPATPRTIRRDVDADDRRLLHALLRGDEQREF